MGVRTVINGKDALLKKRAILIKNTDLEKRNKNKLGIPPEIKG